MTCSQVGRGDISRALWARHVFHAVAYGTNPINAYFIFFKSKFFFYIVRVRFDYDQCWGLIYNNINIKIFLALLDSSGSALDYIELISSTITSLTLIYIKYVPLVP